MQCELSASLLVGTNPVSLGNNSEREEKLKILKQIYELKGQLSELQDFDSSSGDTSAQSHAAFNNLEQKHDVKVVSQRVVEQAASWHVFIPAIHGMRDISGTLSKLVSEDPRYCT